MKFHPSYVFVLLFVVVILLISQVLAISQDNAPLDFPANPARPPKLCVAYRHICIDTNSGPQTKDLCENVVRVCVLTRPSEVKLRSKYNYVL